MGFLKVLLLVLFCSSAFAAEDEISTILQKPGALVFTKSESIPSHLRDGSPIYYELVIYNGSTHSVGTQDDPNLGLRRHKLRCLGGYSLETNYLSHQGPADLNILQGTTYQWVFPEYSKPTPENGYLENFGLRFVGPHSLVEISCSVAHQFPGERATVSDFEEATGGRMSLSSIH